MPNQSNLPHPSRIAIYQKFTELGFNIGSFEDFNEKMKNQKGRWNFYSMATGANMPIGTWEEFNLKMS